MDQQISSNDLQFALKEIDYLTKEVEYRTLDQNKVERDVVIGIWLVYAALATVHNYVPAVAAKLGYLWLVPILLALFGAARFFDNHRAIRRIGSYLRELEGRLGPAAGGWQRYSEKHSGWDVAWTARFFSWFVLIGITVAIPVAI